MSTYKVEICGVNTAQLPILKEEEKEELFKKIKAGDKASRETYIKGNLRLVLSVIKRFNNHNENVDDLFQIGCIGLMKALLVKSAGICGITAVTAFRVHCAILHIKPCRQRNGWQKMRRRNRLSKRLQPNVRFRWRMWCMPWMPSRRP